MFLTRGDIPDCVNHQEVYQGHLRLSSVEASNQPCVLLTFSAVLLCVRPSLRPSVCSGGPGEKVMQDDEFTCDLFRFLQLLCEGHNSGVCYCV